MMYVWISWQFVKWLFILWALKVFIHTYREVRIGYIKPMYQVIPPFQTFKVMFQRIHWDRWLGNMVELTILRSWFPIFVPQFQKINRCWNIHMQCIPFYTSSCFSCICCDIELWCYFLNWENNYQQETTSYTYCWVPK
jgi:hypothetical protein